MSFKVDTVARIYHEGKYIELQKDPDFDTAAPELLKRRCESYEKDEPKTIEWIESFVDKSIFCDVGSNVGGYSFIASMIHKNIRIYSFEPNFINFYSQTKTCLKNNIKNVFSFNLAINKENTFDYFKYDAVNNGSKGNFGEELKEKMLRSDHGNPFRRGISSEIGTMGISLDTLVYDFGFEVPNYLKIDVDGNELFVLQGAKQLLKDNALKQIFIEIDDKIYDNSEIEKFMKNYSFDLALDVTLGEEVEMAALEDFLTTSTISVDSLYHKKNESWLDRHNRLVEIQKNNANLPSRNRPHSKREPTTSITIPKPIRMALYKR